MARTSLQDVRSVGDPLQQYNWDIIIPNLPGGGASRDLTVKAMSTTIPGSTIEEAAVKLHGVEVRYAGTENYDHQWQVTFLETRSMSTRNAIMGWKKSIRNWDTNSGSYKSVYGTTIQLLLYDDLPQVVQVLQLTGAWPQTVDAATIDGGQSGAVTFGVTFSYDEVIDITGASASIGT